MKENKKFRILSIDGGGTRGVIPIHLLKHIEFVTGKRIHQLFDLIVGTSTGGLIAAGISVSEDLTTPKYQLDDVLNIYKKFGSAIFPNRNFFHKANSIFNPLYRSKGILSVLDHFFGDKCIGDCIVPIIMTSYNLLESKPIIFRSRDANLNSAGASYIKNTRLVDICRATSAAPYYFGSHTFNYSDDSGYDNKKVTCIDGGVYINNPTLLGYAEILANKSDPLYDSEGLSDEDIYVLSIGTGSYINQKVLSKTENWGIYKWAKTKSILEVMMTGSSKITDEHARTLINKNAFSENYLRAQINIPDKKFSDMDLSDAASLNYYKNQVNKQLLSNNMFLNSLNRFLENL